MKRAPGNQKGFTMIELLIVIGIMAVLAGVAVGAFTGLIGTGTPEAKAAEKASVQTAVDAYMATNKLTAITARSTAAVVATADADAPFKAYLRRLPTQYSYSWIADGTVTQP